MDTSNVAFKLRVKDVLTGSYVRTEGQFEPNYLLVGDRKVSRVNIIAVVVSSEDEGIVIDDGTGSISVRMAESGIKLPPAGTVAIIIGRPREFSSSIYIAPEIVKQLDSAWLEFRKKELGKEAVPKPEIVLNLVKSLDTGQGADIDEVIRKSGIPGCQKIIDLLMQEGDIFQVRPGRLKALE
jgi:RPA family protein